MASFDIARAASIVIGMPGAGVVELVDARDSKTFENYKNLANTSVFSHIFRQMI